MDTFGVVVSRPHGLVLIHADFFDDDVLLHVEVFLAQAGAENVGDDVHGLRQVFGQDGGIEDGVFFTGEGIVVGADAVEVAIDVKSRAAWRALEDHVFKEMRDAGNVANLIACPGTDEETDGDRTCCRVGLADDLQAVGENVGMKTITWL